MSNSFGFQLNQFAQAVDIMDGETFDHVAEATECYVGDVLGAHFHAVWLGGARTDTDAGSVSALQSMPHLSRTLPSSVTPIFDTSGRHRGQCEFAFDRGKNLWMVKDDQSPLNADTGTFVDRWECSEELPPYRHSGTSDETRTSIVCPLRYRGESMESRVMGVLTLEFEECLTASQRAKEDIRQLADALARMVWLRETSSAQNKDRRDAFRSLSKRLSVCHSRLAKPKVFLAAGSRAKKDVVRCIRSVLEEFDDVVEEVFWEEVHDSGSVPLSVLKSISECELGICYFSEILKDRKRYTDNSNVLFEAGMLHALANDPLAAPKGWIPVREDESKTSRAPFDFAAERMIVIRRKSKDVLDDECLKSELRARIEGMLDTSVTSNG